MDSRVSAIAAALAAVMLVLGIGGHYVRKYLKAHPILSIVATVALFIGAFLVIADRTQFSAWLDCLSTHRLVCIA